MSESIPGGDIDCMLRMGVLVRVLNNIACPQCDGCGQVIMEEWKNPRPCDVCRGAGQIHMREVPKCPCGRDDCEG